MVWDDLYMANGVWFINDAGAVINPASFVVSNRATIRIRRAERNYALTGNSTRLTLWARANAYVTDFALAAALNERSADPLPSDVPVPTPAPTPVTPSAGSVPIPSGVPPYPYGMVAWDAKNGAWVWVEVEVKPAAGGTGTFPSLSTFPSVGLFPS